jgi:hypothetical protein
MGKSELRLRFSLSGSRFLCVRSRVALMFAESGLDVLHGGMKLMRTIQGVLSGFLVTSALILAGGWASGALLGAAVGNEYASPTLPAALLALLYTAAAIVAGAYVAVRIHDTGDTITAFTIVQLFFGFGLVREFWLTGSSWYTLTALVLIIPCAIIGRRLARRLGHHSDRMAGTV